MSVTIVQKMTDVPLLPLSPEMVLLTLLSVSRSMCLFEI